MGGIQPQQQNPFTVHLQVDTSAAQREGNPFMEHIASVVPQGIPTTMRGIMAFEKQHNEQYIAQLRSLLDIPHMTDEQRRRIDMLIKQAEGKIKIGNVMDFVEGVGTGLINWGVLGTTDMVAALGQLMLPKPMERLVGIPQLREKIAESQAIVQEGLGAEGVAGTAGQVVGGIAGMALPYGTVGRATGLALMRFAPGTRAAKAFQALMTGKGTYAQRVGANILGGVPLDALRAAGLPNATPRERLEAFLIDTGLGVAGAFAIETAPIQAMFTKTADGVRMARRVASSRAERPTPEQVAERTATVERFEEQRAELKAEKKLTKEMASLSDSELFVAQRDAWATGTNTTEDVMTRRVITAELEKRGHDPGGFFRKETDEVVFGAAGFRSLDGKRAAFRDTTPEGHEIWALSEDDKPGLLRIVDDIEKAFNYVKGDDAKVYALDRPGDMSELSPEQRAALGEKVKPRPAVDDTIRAAKRETVQALNDAELQDAHQSVQRFLARTDLDAEMRSDAELDLVVIGEEMAKRGIEPIELGLAALGVDLRKIVDDPSTPYVMRKLIKDFVESGADSHDFLEALKQADTAHATLLKPKNPLAQQILDTLKSGGRDSVDVGNEIGELIRVFERHALPPTLKRDIGNARALTKAPESPDDAAKQLGEMLNLAGVDDVRLEAVARALTPEESEAISKNLMRMDQWLRDRGRSDDADKALRLGMWLGNIAPDGNLFMPFKELDANVEKIKKILHDLYKHKRPAPEGPDLDDLSNNPFLAEYNPFFDPMGAANKVQFRVTSGPNMQHLLDRIGAVLPYVGPESYGKFFDALVDDLIHFGQLEGLDPARVVERLRIYTSLVEDGSGQYTPNATEAARRLGQYLDDKYPVEGQIDFPQIHYKSPIGDKPLVEMSAAELDAKVSELQTAFEDGRISGDELGVWVEAIGEAKRAIRIRASNLGASPQAPHTKSIMDSSEFNNLMAKPVESMSVDELNRMHTELVHRAGYMKSGPSHDKLTEVIARLKKLNRERPDAGFTIPELPMIMTGSTVGFFVGLMTGDTPEQRIRNALMTAAGAGITLTAFTRLRSRTAARVVNDPPWVTKVREKVKSVEDEPENASKGLLSWLERLYFENVRRSYPVEKIYKLVGANKLPLKISAAKQLEMFGLWKRQSDAAIFDQPTLVDDVGNIQAADAPSLVQIAQMVDGDTRSFGEFLIAARSLEMYSRGKAPPVDIVAAKQYFINAPQRFHDAQKAALKYARWLADVGTQAGLINPQTRALFENDLFYVPLIRLFAGEPGAPKTGVGSRKRVEKGVKAPQPFQQLKTSVRPVRNGFEALYENTSRILRASEQNRMMLQFANMVEQLRLSGRKDLADYIARPIQAKTLRDSPVGQAQIDEIKAELEALGKYVSDVEAEHIALMFGDEQINVTDGTMTMFRDGKTERWRIHEDVALAMRSLNSDELSMLTRVLGAPAQLARLGITASPRFVFWQAFRDNFQLWMNSPEWFGYIPFVDQARGWWHAVTASPEYRKAVAAGLTGESLTAEGLKPRRTRYGRERSVMEDVRVGKGQTLAQKTIANIKTMNLRELYADLIVPIADAARVGAYLRARGRGAPVLEAVYRAKRVGVNYGQRGHGRLINNLNHMTLFLNPSLQSVDEAARAFARDPIKYTVKAFAGITLPSIYLWFEYKDDDEIQELRKTESGRRYWWLRDMTGEIRRIPKPILDGQLWGASVEAWLDRMRAGDPTAVDTWARALAQDGAIHLLPTVLAVPGSVAANWNLSFGGPVVPEAAGRFDPELQFNRGTTEAARIAGSALAPVSRFFQQHEMDALARALSPAGIDYIVRNVGGEISHELLKGLGQAIRYTTEPGFSVTKEEAPFISSVFPRFPSTGAASLREFYKTARIAEQRAATFVRKINTEPERAGAYFEENHGIIGLLDLYTSVRSDIADLRASLIDIEENRELSSKDRREIGDEIIRTMIIAARSANEVSRMIMAETKMPAMK